MLPQLLLFDILVFDIQGYVYENLILKKKFWT